MKTKKLRETRTAYRARTTRTRGAKPRAIRSRRQVMAVPWEKRIAPTDSQLAEWGAWLDLRETEFEKKYPGQYLAVWGKRVIATAATRAQLYVLADKARPEVIPLVTYIPFAEDIFVVPSNFPVAWIEEANGKRAK